MTAGKNRSLAPRPGAVTVQLTGRAGSDANEFRLHVIRADRGRCLRSSSWGGEGRGGVPLAKMKQRSTTTCHGWRMVMMEPNKTLGV